MTAVSWSSTFRYWSLGFGFWDGFFHELSSYFRHGKRSILPPEDERYEYNRNDYKYWWWLCFSPRIVPNLTKCSLAFTFPTHYISWHEEHRCLQFQLYIFLQINDPNFLNWRRRRILSAVKPYQISEYRHNVPKKWKKNQ